ncbi:DUF5995 family protein [Granulicella tundricola]|uniref:Uncharacterized protein n=1 Tax=Granulicella tundricola (strain ATCC BAA-1859 / DSM 23138 / MP5ACTX9) TaxID=1198114 RepID=E8X6I7_GRATM|nr:DUF5995 family protein [Granulicella tundricola]ADW71071.1 hypothetical protein AciX9_4303 [Granulicella tundricola MP5ACTX9]
MQPSLLSLADQSLYNIVSTATPATIADVIATMQAIDALLPPEDGLKWFNRLYLMVTQQVDFNPPAGGWKNPRWLTQLDVVFAGLYFKAVADFLAGRPIPASWSAMFASRHTPGIDRIQFALAGMNAHINHDLALALIATDTALNVTPTLTSPEFTDYQAVNQLLNALMPATLTMLATDTLGVLAQDTGKVGRLLAFWDMCRARELAWLFADHLSSLAGPPRALALNAQDSMTGVLARAILAFS